MKERAFVRYTKHGKIVPGSLIVTTKGGYPSGPALWKEVTVDQCCPPLPSNITIDSNDFGDPVGDDTITLVFGAISCPELTLVFEAPTPAGFTSMDEIVDYLNSTYSNLGVFTYSGGPVTYTITLEASEIFVELYPRCIESVTLEVTVA